MAKGKGGGKGKAPAGKKADAIVPMFNKPLSELTTEELDEAFDSGALQLVPPEPAKKKSDELIDLEAVEKFIMGEITWAQLQGITLEQAYAIAEYGFKLFQEARYHDARTIFEGLVIANPYDAYFHNMLGAVYQQLDMKEEAVEEYTSAIELDSEHLHAYVNRAELLLLAGQFEKALSDLKRAVELDPDGKDSASLRARALAAATSQAVKEIQKAGVVPGKRK